MSEVRRPFSGRPPEKTSLLAVVATSQEASQRAKARGVAKPSRVPPLRSRTLSGWMLAAFAAALVPVALFLTRRS